MNVLIVEHELHAASDDINYTKLDLGTLYKSVFLIAAFREMLMCIQ